MYQAAGDLLAGRAWLSNEWRNVVAAARYADQENKPTEAVWLRRRLTGYFFLTSNWRTWEKIGFEAYRAASQAQDKYSLTATLGNFAVLWVMQNQAGEAADYAREGMTLVQQTEDKALLQQLQQNLDYCIAQSEAS